MDCIWYNRVRLRTEKLLQVWRSRLQLYHPTSHNCDLLSHPGWSGCVFKYLNSATSSVLTFRVDNSEMISGSLPPLQWCYILLEVLLKSPVLLSVVTWTFMLISGDFRPIFRFEYLTLPPKWNMLLLPMHEIHYSAH